MTLTLDVSFALGTFFEVQKGSFREQSCVPKLSPKNQQAINNCLARAIGDLEDKFKDKDPGKALPIKVCAIYRSNDTVVVVVPVPDHREELASFRSLENPSEKAVAEREGFEPPIRLPVCRISSAVHSTTLPPLRRDTPKACPDSIGVRTDGRKSLANSLVEGGARLARALGGQQGRRTVRRRLSGRERLTNEGAARIWQG